jgi:hypothetical protein
MWSGQILFSYGGLPIVFNVIADGRGIPTLQLPSFDSKAADANTLFNTIEFTLDASGTMWTNNTNVDAFVGPMLTTLVGAKTQSNGAMLPGVTRDDIFEAFVTALPPFNNLVWKTDAGLVRVYNPTVATTPTTDLLPAGYFDGAVAACIQTFAEAPLTIVYNSKTYLCQFTGNVLVCTCDGVKVATRDFGSLLGNAHEIFGCGNSIFDRSGVDGAGKDIDPVLTAGLNRGLLPGNALLPNCGNIEFYPPGVPSNGYAKILHPFFEAGSVYAFPFDDVCGASSELVDPTPESLAITLGAW